MYRALRTADLTLMQGRVAIGTRAWVIGLSSNPSSLAPLTYHRLNASNPHCLHLQRHS